MEFTADSKPVFIRHFKEKQIQIENFDGCYSVELLQDSKDELVLATFSIWQNEQYLELYRQSEFFKATWAVVKPLFNSKAQAWSYINNTEDE